MSQNRVKARMNNRYRVLLTDYEQRRWPDLQDLLGLMDIVAISADSGAEALRIARRQKIHAAVVEENLPTLGGLQTVEQLRKVRQTMPCILVAWHPGKYLLQRALSLEIFSVVDREVPTEILAGQVLRALRRFHAIDPARLDTAVLERLLKSDLDRILELPDPGELN